MEQEYGTSIFYKVFYGLGSIIAVAFTFYIALFDMGRHPEHKGVVVLPILGIIGAVLTAINLYKRKVIISDDSIQYISVWGAKELLNNEVKGFKTLDKRIVIYPIDEHSHKLNLRDYSSIDNLDGLVKDLTKHYTDLDAVGYQGNLNEIYNNPQLGESKDERIEKFNSSKRFALIYNIGGALMFVVSLIFTDSVLNNDYIKIILILYPLIGIILIILSKGLIKLVSARRSAFGSLIVGLYTSTIAIAIALISYYDFVDYADLWVPLIIIALIIGAILWIYGYDRSENAVKAQIVILVLISVLYACPLTMFINCKLDTTIPKVYNVKILDRHIYYNNSRAYYHVVVATSAYTSLPSKDLHINKNLYERVESMQVVHVDVKQGLLHIPWFYINE